MHWRSVCVFFLQTVAKTEVSICLYLFVYTYFIYLKTTTKGSLLMFITALFLQAKIDHQMSLKKTMKMFFFFKKEVKTKKKARHTFQTFFSGTSKSSEQLTFFT